MKDIALRAGVTTATVSMSLRNRPGISPETRERVTAIARELGYKPNPYVSALMRTRRSGRDATSGPVIALVCALDQPDGWRNSPSAMRRQILEGAMARTAELGYHGQEFWLHRDDMSPERFSQMLRARGIEGLLLGPLPDGGAPPALRWEEFAAVTLSVPFRTFPLHAVCNDHYFSSLLAVTECQRLGYCRPGLLMRRSHRDLFQGRWEAGFFTAQRSLAGLEEVQPLFVDTTEEDTPDLRTNFRRWVKKEKPDVIVSMASHVVERELRRMEIKVPREIGMVALTCPELGHRLSGVCQQGRMIGATAVDVLIAMMERGERGLPQHGVTTMVEGLWNPGETVRPQTSGR